MRRSFHLSVLPFTGSLQKFEVPQKIVLTDEVWMPDTGLVTDSLKLKRKPLTDHYQAAVHKMYQQ